MRPFRLVQGSAHLRVQWPFARNVPVGKSVAPPRLVLRAMRCLTLRSSGAPTAGHQARAAPWFMLHRTGLASCRRRPLSSNVRPRNQSASVLLRYNSQMLSPVTMIRSAVVVIALSNVSLAAVAVTCEELRASVESKIRDRGVTSFTVAIANAAASAPGQVVGTCERGSKKLVYSREPSPAPPASQVTPAAKPGPTPRKPVITECADGRVITEGSCRK